MIDGYKQFNVKIKVTEYYKIGMMWHIKSKKTYDEFFLIKDNSSIEDEMRNRFYDMINNPLNNIIIEVEEITETKARYKQRELVFGDEEIYDYE